jgi:hypothetical protein
MLKCQGQAGVYGGDCKKIRDVVINLLERLGSSRNNAAYFCRNKKLITSISNDSLWETKLIFYVYWSTVFYQEIPDLFVSHLFRPVCVYIRLTKDDWASAILVLKARYKNTNIMLAFFSETFSMDNISIER